MIAVGNARAEYRTENNQSAKDKVVSRVTRDAIMRIRAADYSPTVEDCVLMGLPLFARHTSNPRHSATAAAERDRYSTLCESLESCGD